MNQNWQNFLTQHNATVTAGIVQHFSDCVAELKMTADSSVLCDLSQYGTLRVSGEDRKTFLQSMLSNDIGGVNDTHAQYSSLNTAKGRVLANMLIWQDHDSYLLQLPLALCEPIRKKLSMYVLRAKVNITDVSNEIITLGFSGKDAHALLKKHFEHIPNEPLAVAFNPTSAPQMDIATSQLVRISDTRFQITASPETMPSIWEMLHLHAQAVGSPYWDWLNIHSGIPTILSQTQEQFVAQMVNLDQIGGINFKKGCYPGQEIIARMHYLGKLKRRMFLAHIDMLNAPDAGDELFSADMPEQASGMIVNVAPSPNGGYDLLAVVQLSSKASQSIHYKSLAGTKLQFLSMPYALPESSE